MTDEIPSPDDAPLEYTITARERILFYVGVGLGLSLGSLFIYLGLSSLLLRPPDGPALVQTIVGAFAVSVAAYSLGLLVKTPTHDSK